jgi:hypothetical protein
MIRRPEKFLSPQPVIAPERREAIMNPSEAKILRQFRSYGLRTNEMLFFNRSLAKPHLPEFVRAIQTLVDRGMIVQERHQDAYSLTTRGYQASISA